jgi:hypothetical protein
LAIPRTSTSTSWWQKKKKLLPPVNWRWVINKEGDGYVRHEGLAPYPYQLVADSCGT